MDIKIVDQLGKEVVQTQTEIGEPSTVIADGVLLADQVAKVFDILPSEMGTYRDKIETLVEYAKLKTDDHSPDGLKWALRSLGHKLGTPPLGEKLVNYLHVYAKLYLQGRQIEAQKDKFLRGERD